MVKITTDAPVFFKGFTMENPFIVANTISQITYHTYCIELSTGYVHPSLVCVWNPWFAIGKPALLAQTLYTLAKEKILK